MKRSTLPVSLLLLSLPLASHAQWAPDGVVISTALSNQTTPQSVSDGSGGAFITWADFRSGDDDIYVHRVDRNGQRMWMPQNGVAIRIATNDQFGPRIVSDGAGGAIVVWVEGRNNGTTDIYAQRIDSGGTTQWAVGGVVLCAEQHDQHSINAISDGAGGVIAVWEDERAGSAMVMDVYAQRVNENGVTQWTSGGVAVCTAVNQQSYPVLATDSAGGAIFAWSDYRDGIDRDIFAQRVNSAGTALWGTDGVNVCGASFDQDAPAVTIDGNGGAIVAWTDARSGSSWDIYAQHVNSTGAAEWPANGVVVCNATFAQNDPQIVADNGGGAIVAWNDQRDLGTTNTDIYAQRVNASGAVQWTGNGVALCTASGEQVFARVTSTGTGGAVVAWMDTRSGGLNYDIYAQRINGAGTVQWAANGVVLCAAANQQSSPCITTDGSGGAIVAWQDFRSGNNDIYANRITQGGAIPTGIGESPAVSSIIVGDAFPNPFSGATSVDLTIQRETRVRVELFDVAGRRVRDLDLGSLRAGPARISFDGRDARSRLLPSGVYFYRIHAGAEVVTRKLVIQR